MTSSNSGTPIVAVLVIGHADIARRVEPQLRSKFESDKSRERASKVLSLLKQEIAQRAGAGNRGVLTALETKSVGVGSEQLLIKEKAGATLSEAEMRLNRRVEVFLARCRIPPDRPAIDTLDSWIDRLTKLLQARRVQPDTTGGRTSRAKCLLSKLARPGVIDVFVDGGLANATINGVTPRFEESIIPGRNVGWLGNYDSDKKPMPDVDFLKFLATIRPILNGPGFAPTQSDDHVLNLLGLVILRIDEGVEMVDAYITRMGMMSDPIVKEIFRVSGFAGDNARKKLQGLYRNHLDDESNIYSCYR